MSPEEPGAPDDAQRDTGSTPTFGSGAEQTDRPGLPGGAPGHREPDRPAPSPPPSTPAGSPPRPASSEPPAAAPRDPAPSAVPPIPRDLTPAAERPGSPPPTPSAEAPTADAAEPPAPKVVAPTARKRFLDDPDPDPEAPKAAPRAQRVRHRKVRRIVRHIEPWSVLKVSALFFASIFLIICIASAVLWNAARSAGAIDDVESFITSLGFGNCEDIEPEATTEEETPSTIDGSQPQVGASSSSTSSTVPEPEDERSAIPDEDGECAEGQRLVGGFKFEDERIFQSFALFGIVLVLSGAAASVVMALLFNLISDLTGGVRVTVLEEEPTRVRTGSPPGRGDG